MLDFPNSCKMYTNIEILLTNFLCNHWYALILKVREDKLSEFSDMVNITPSFIILLVIVSHHCRLLHWNEWKLTDAENNAAENSLFVWQQTLQYYLHVASL